MTDKRAGYSLKDDLGPIMEGKVDLPNFKTLSVREAVSNACACYGGSTKGRARVPGTTLGAWAQYFIDYGQNGQLYGSGLVLIYEPDGAVAGKFAICEHTKQPGVGAQPHRGWHPGHCSKCGLDMTIDSGD